MKNHWCIQEFGAVAKMAKKKSFAAEVRSCKCLLFCIFRLLEQWRHKKTYGTYYRTSPPP